jgi:hypothetical protein
MRVKTKVTSNMIDLRQLAVEIAQDVIASAMEGPAKNLEDLMRGYAPKREGNLARSIGRKVVVNVKKTAATAIVGPRRRSRGRPTRSAHNVEFGHVAVAPRKGTSRRKKNASVRGFVAARPFMRPAVATFSAMAQARLGTEFEQKLDVKLVRMKGKTRQRVLV